MTDLQGTVLLHSENEIQIPSDGKVNPIRLCQQDVSGESPGVRYRFRILLWEIIRKDYQHLEDLTFDMLHIPAQILDINPNEQIYKEKILIIGSVNEKLGDVHLTPVGKMPGVFLIANGLNLFLKGNQIHEISSEIRFLIEMVLIVLAAYIFLRLPSALAGLIFSLIFLIFYVPLNTWLLIQLDVSLNFWRLIVGIGILEFIAIWKEVIDWFQQQN